MRHLPPPMPEPALPELRRFVGRWVAVKNGRVVADAATSRELVPAVRALGQDGHGAVAQFVTPPTDTIVIGVG